MPFGPLTIEDALNRWNSHCDSSKRLEFQRPEQNKVAGLGHAIFATYNENNGWQLTEIGNRNCLVASIIRVIRFLHFGYRETILTDTQKNTLRKLGLISGAHFDTRILRMLPMALGVK